MITRPEPLDVETGNSTFQTGGFAAVSCKLPRTLTTAVATGAKAPASSEQPPSPTCISLPPSCEPLPSSQPTATPNADMAAAILHSPLGTRPFYQVCTDIESLG